MKNMSGMIIGGLLPAVVFGITGFLQKNCAKSGMGTALYICLIGIGVLITGMGIFMFWPEKNLPFKPALIAVLMGGLWSVGTALILFSIMKYNTPLSKLVPLYNMNTLIAVLLSLVVFSEWKDVHFMKLIIGTFLIIAGGTLVAGA